MIVIIGAGLCALIFGRIPIWRGWTLREKFARAYGAALLILCLPVVLLYSTAVTLIWPESIIEEEVITKIADLVFLVIFLLVTAYPFKKWQEVSGGDISVSAKSPDAHWKTKVTTVVLLGTAALSCLLLFTMFRGCQALNKFEKTRKEGEQFGKTHQAEECFDKVMNEEDSELQVTEMIKRSMFLEACLETASGMPALCQKIGESDSATLEDPGQKIFKCRGNENKIKYCKLLLEDVREKCDEARKWEKKLSPR
jgi:hypothetical protein